MQLLSSAILAPKQLYTTCKEGTLLSIHPSVHPTIQTSQHPFIHPSYSSIHPPHPTKKYSLTIYQVSGTLDIKANESPPSHSRDSFGHIGLHSVPGTCTCFPASGPLHMSFLPLKHLLPSVPCNSLYSHSYGPSDLSFSCTEDLPDSPIILNPDTPSVFLSYHLENLKYLMYFNLNLFCGSLPH